MTRRTGTAAAEVSDARIAVSAAQAGAAVVRARYGTPHSRMAKGPADFATDADIDAERQILAIIRAARPDDGWTGEELGSSGGADSGRRWLIDPLCGTLNFAARTPLAAVNVALQNGDHLEAAACADPTAGEVFWTDGQNAQVRRNGRDETLRPSPQTHLADVNLDAPYPNADWFRAAALLADPAFTAAFRPRVISSTLALAWVAAGRRAAYITDGEVGGSVHFAAGIALCQAAGAVITGLHGQPLHTGTGGLVAAADTGTHAALIGIINCQAAAAGFSERPAHDLGTR